MKKFLFICILAISVCACVSDEPNAQIMEQDSNISSKYRTTEEILDIAANAVNMLSDAFDPEVTSRSFGRTVDFSTPVYHICNIASRFNSIDTLMHVVNYANDMGFAIISAKRNFPEVLAVTESGHYNPAEPSEIEGFNMWIDQMQDALEWKDIHDIDTTSMKGKDDPINDKIPVIKPKTVRDTVWLHHIRDRVRVKWGQDKKRLENACEGDYYPNQCAGCSNIAMAMAMTFVERPTSLVMTFVNETYPTALNWTEIKKYLSLDAKTLEIFPSSSYPIRLTVSQLCRELGKRTNSVYYYGYGEDSSTTKTDPAETIRVLKELGVTTQANWIDGNGVSWYEVLKNSSEECILLVRATDSNGDDGHQWICDGIQNYKIRERYYESEDAGITWRLKDTSYSPEYYYNHYNWGWHGYCNGYYYNVDTYTRSQGQLTGHNFDKNQQYIKISK